MPSNCEVIRAFKMNGVEVKTLEQYLESALSIMENSLQNESSLPRVETQPPINAVQQPVPTKTNRARINEFCQVNFSQQPEYKYTQGVDEFVCVASIENFEAIGRGKQKSDAREEACGKLLEKLKSPDRLTSQSGTPVSLPPTKSQPIAAPKPQPRPTSPPKESNVREKSPISPSQNPLPPCENWVCISSISMLSSLISNWCFFVDKKTSRISQYEIQICGAQFWSNWQSIQVHTTI